MNAKAALYFVLLFAMAIGARTFADDATGEKPNIAVNWDVSGFKTRIISISLKNNGNQPVRFRKYLDVKYMVEGEKLEKAIPDGHVDFDMSEVVPVVVLVSKKESITTRYVSLGPHLEEMPLEVAPNDSKTIKLHFDEKYVTSFNEAEEILLLLLKDGKILQKVTMKKQDGVWREAD